MQQQSSTRQQTGDFPESISLERPSVIVVTASGRHALRRELAHQGLRRPFAFGIFWPCDDGPDAVLDIKMPFDALSAVWTQLGSGSPDDEMYVIPSRDSATIFTQAREIERLRQVLHDTGAVHRFAAHHTRCEWMDGRAYAALLAAERFPRIDDGPAGEVKAWVLALPTPPENRAIVDSIHRAFNRALHRLCAAWEESGGYAPTPEVRLELALSLVERQVEGLVEGPLPIGTEIRATWPIERQFLATIQVTEYAVPVGEDRMKILIDVEMEGGGAGRTHA